MAAICDGTRIVESRLFAFVSASASVTQMLKFWSLDLAPGWGQRSISMMMSMFKFLVIVFFDTYF